MQICIQTIHKNQKKKNVIILHKFQYLDHYRIHSSQWLRMIRFHDCQIVCSNICFGFSICMDCKIYNSAEICCLVFLTLLNAFHISSFFLHEFCCQIYLHVVSFIQGAAFNVTHFKLAILLVWVVGGVADNQVICADNGGWVPRGLGFSEQWNVGPCSSAYFVWNSSC